MSLSNLTQPLSKFIAMTVVLLVTASSVVAQDDEPQHWQGILDVGAAKLTLNFEITKDGDNYSGTIFSVEQGNAAIPISSMTIEGNKVVVEANSVMAVFEGTLNDERNLATGKWTQRGTEYELEIRKMEAPPAEHIETWKGTLEMGVKLELGLKVYKDNDGTLTATLDSYSQGALGIPVRFERDGNTYKMAHRRMKMRYVATLNDDEDKLVGTFKQAGVEVPLEFEKAELDYKPSVNRPQHPKEPFPYDVTDVSYENSEDSVTLAGTLTVPKGDGPFPVAIMISGSGPQDRDESLLGHKPFLVIADHLTRSGIAVLRFDDRGVAGSTGDFSKATSADFAKDVGAGIDFLKTNPKIDSGKIGLVGHSEGGLIAPIVAAERDDVAFIVLMAGPGVDGARILESQSSAMLEASGESEAMIQANRQIFAVALEVVRSGDQVTAEAIESACRAELEKIEDEKIRETMETNLAALGPMLVSPWMQYFIKYDPAVSLKKVECPVLALNGEKDLQVLVDLNLDAIEKALTDGGNESFSIVRFPNMNHLFQETEGPGLPANYGSIEETFSPKALNAISEWIQKNTQR